MKPSEINRHKTALKRYNFSRPVNIAISDGLIDQSKAFFDYGCGHGDDIKLLEKIGVHCSGWDPEFRPSSPKQPADIVNLGYVINVIEDQKERAITLKSAWELAKDLLVVSAQLYIDAKTANYSPFKDGFLTKRGTFQKYFEQQELRQWINSTLGESPVPAGPGIFYVFRDPAVKEAFVSSRYRRRAAAPRLRKSDELFNRYNDILQPLIDFITARGRVPDPKELNVAPTIIENIGSIKQAFRIIRIVTDEIHWDQIAEERSQDLLIYLALACFDGRKKFSELPQALQLDVRAFFSTYKRACNLADTLLFACGNREKINAACKESSVGKVTPSALYVHISALDGLSPLLRAYEGCGRSYLGIVEGVNIIKLHRLKPKISYLSYPDFETKPHPALASSLSVNLQTFRIKTYQYKTSVNPPILHRKELFISPEHNLHARFARLTRSEERTGLFDHTSNIGRMNEWNDLLAEKGVYLRGHRLLRQKK
ncbi:hypothetical protein D3OALGA1CA_5066 [Olavius algarvensis associated proteobacterium Delta 3]|nr:hypothetical protein D3OALGA1CA_5066 [Olavius algarvensis associated proteobacterium Delta 3]